MAQSIVDTLGKYADEGYRYNIWCVPCQRGGLLDPAVLVERLGRDHNLDVAYSIKCGQCGGKQIEVRIQPPAPRI